MDTVTSKNVAIAEMVGWEAKKTLLGETLIWISKEHNHLVPNFKHTMNGKYYCLPQELLFHSDANWQYEALDWLDSFDNGKEYVEFMMMEKTNIGIYVRDKQTGLTYFEYLTVLQDVKFNTRKEAVFEALFQFSQYLKQQK